MVFSVSAAIAYYSTRKLRNLLCIQQTSCRVDNKAHSLWHSLCCCFHRFLLSAELSCAEGRGGGTTAP